MNVHCFRWRCQKKKSLLPPTPVLSLHGKEIIDSTDDIPDLEPSLQQLVVQMNSLEYMMNKIMETQNFVKQQYISFAGENMGQEFLVLHTIYFFFLVSFFYS